MASFSGMTHAAGCCPSVANNIGDSLAQSQSECGLFFRGERRAVQWGTFEDEGNACGVQCTARGFNFGSQAACTVAGDRIADLPKRGSRRFFKIAHLLPGPRHGARRVERDQATSELGL